MNSLLKNIEDINDKAYIIANTINFTHNETYNEMVAIESANNNEDLDFIKKSKYYLFNTNENSHFIRRISQMEKASDFLMRIFNHPSDTMENLAECFHTASECVQKNLLYLRAHDKFLLMNLLQWKSKALFLRFKINPLNNLDIKNNDIYNFNDNLKESLNIFFNSYDELSDNERTILCYTLGRKFNIDPVNFANILNIYMTDDSCDISNKLANMPNDITSFTITTANSNSTDYHNDSMIANDHLDITVLSDGPFFNDVDIKAVRNEILTLINGDILNFDANVNNIDEISFRINSNEIAALRESAKLKLAIICIDKTKYFTCIMVEDQIPSLAYHVNNDENHIHCISIFEDENNERALVDYIVPHENKYLIEY